MKGDGPLNTLKPQPGQSNAYQHTNHALPGPWAQQQLSEGTQRYNSQPRSSTGRQSTEIQRALAAENAQHNYWDEWQGIQPGKPVYEDPRAFQNTLLPVARYGTDGRGD